MPLHRQRTHAIPRLAQYHDRPLSLTLRIPEPDAGVKTATHDHCIALAAEAHRLDAPCVSAYAAAETTQRARRSYVPEEDGLVAAARGKARVVGGDGEGEDGVGVCAGVGLDELGVGGG